MPRDKRDMSGHFRTLSGQNDGFLRFLGLRDIYRDIGGAGYGQRDGQDISP